MWIENIIINKREGGKNRQVVRKMLYNLRKQSGVYLGHIFRNVAQKLIGEGGS